MNPVLLSSLGMGSSVGKPVIIKGLDVYESHLDMDMINGISKLHQKHLGTLSPLPIDRIVRDTLGRDIGQVDRR